MNSTTRTLFTGLLILIATLLFLALLAVAYYLLSPRPAHAQSVNIKTAPLKWSGDGLKFELQTMPLDLVRAFFQGRGFSKHNAEIIAQEGCIFRSAIGNSGGKVTDPAISIELAKWRIITANKTSAPRTREDWDVIWEQKKAPDQAKTAFYWALFPTKQTYQASDYNWGMISFALAPQSRFNLEVHWQIAGIPKKHVFKNLECGK